MKDTIVKTLSINLIFLDTLSLKNTAIEIAKNKVMPIYCLINAIQIRDGSNNKYLFFKLYKQYIDKFIKNKSDYLYLLVKSRNAS